MPPDPPQGAPRAGLWGGALQAPCRPRRRRRMRSASHPPASPTCPSSQEFDVDGGQLSGPIPADFARCFPELTELDLSYNFLTGGWYYWVQH